MLKTGKLFDLLPGGTILKLKSYRDGTKAPATVYHLTKTFRLQRDVVPSQASREMTAEAIGTAFYSAQQPITARRNPRTETFRCCTHAHVSW